MKPQPHSPAADGRNPEDQAPTEPGISSSQTSDSAQPWYPVFLATLAATGQVQAAVKAVGITKAKVYLFRKYDPCFAEQWRATLEQLQANPPAHWRGQRKPSAWRGTQPLHWPPLFLKVLAATANVKQAAAKAGISRELAYVHRRHDADFAARWEEAMEVAISMLEVEARRRAIEGERVYRFYQGQPLMHPERPDEPYYEVRYSDKLLIFLLKAHNFAKDDELPVPTEEKEEASESIFSRMDLHMLTIEEQDTLELLLRKATGRERKVAVPPPGSQE